MENNERLKDYKEYVQKQQETEDKLMKELCKEITKKDTK